MLYSAEVKCIGQPAILQMLLTACMGCMLQLLPAPTSQQPAPLQDLQVYGVPLWSKPMNVHTLFASAPLQDPHGVASASTHPIMEPCLF